MCGIAGTFSRLEPDALLRRMERAVRALGRRGPDDRGTEVFAAAQGTVVLGHTRLSIIDLSAGGHQPMQSADGRWLLVFNGEIYNYRELRAELVREGTTFRTDSDTEVLLEAWMRWGRAALPRMIGMFAFGLLDRASHTLTCVRDPFGIKPLFYAAAGGDFHFASELAALSALMPQKLQLDWQSAYDYLVHASYDAGASTFAHGVRQLLPGHLVQLDLAQGQLREDRWWAPTIAPAREVSFENAASQLRDLFLRNVQLHLRSDVPLGAALSGGLDSSAIVCAMRHLQPLVPIHTFSFVATGSAVNEEAWVDRANAHVGAVAHKITVSSAELARDLDDMIAAQGEPFGSTSIYAQYRIFQRAREEGITVTLDGQGADELLAGYQGYPGQRFRSLIDDGRHAAALSFLRQWARWPGRSLSAGAKAAIAACSSDRLYELLRRVGGDRLLPVWLHGGTLREAGVQLRFPRHAAEQAVPGRRVAAELSEALTRRGLPALLRHGDRNSMRFSVESRVPFLTTELADFLLTLPEQYLIADNGESKRILRAALRGIVPEAILDRRDKIGFATPERDWLAQIAPQAREWLREETGLPFLDQPRIVRDFDAMMDGRRPFSWQAWRWINFIRWYNRHMTA